MPPHSGRISHLPSRNVSALAFGAPVSTPRQHLSGVGWCIPSPRGAVSFLRVGSGLICPGCLQVPSTGPGPGWASSGCEWKGTGHMPGQDQLGRTREGPRPLLPLSQARFTLLMSPFSCSFPGPGSRLEIIYRKVFRKFYITKQFTLQLRMKKSNAQHDSKMC